MPGGSGPWSSASISSRCHLPSGVPRARERGVRQDPAAAELQPREVRELTAEPPHPGAQRVFRLAGLDVALGLGPLVEGLSVFQVDDQRPEGRGAPVQAAQGVGEGAADFGAEGREPSGRHPDVPGRRLEGWERCDQGRDGLGVQQPPRRVSRPLVEPGPVERRDARDVGQALLGTRGVDDRIIDADVLERVSPLQWDHVTVCADIRVVRRGRRRQRQSHAAAASARRLGPLPRAESGEELENGLGEGGRVGTRLGRALVLPQALVAHGGQHHVKVDGPDQGPQVLVVGKDLVELTQGLWIAAEPHRAEGACLDAGDGDSREPTDRDRVDKVQHLRIAAHAVLSGACGGFWEEVRSFGRVK
ncbi:hypothetical protein VTK26DRAFT_3916 [Humicola hyalothermophila]